MLNFIVNANSGKGKGFENLKKILKFCFDHKIEYTVHITSAKGHAEQIAKTLCSQGADTLVAVGGDGTFHEIVNGVKEFPETVVGFIPSGRGNDYARAAKLHFDPVKALKDIVAGEVIRTDLVSVGALRCLNVCGTGLDVEVLRAVEGKSNTISYLLALINLLRKFETYKLKVKTIEGEEEFINCIMVGVCNGRYFGGGLHLSPDSVLDDGFLDVLAISMPKDGGIMKALGQFRKGKHIGKEYVKVYKCKEVSVSSDTPVSIELDGEIYDNLALDCKIIKGGLKTFKTTGNKIN